MAASTRAQLVSCGNCLEIEGYILNPMFLPCTHIFCETCLKSHLKYADFIKCKVCDQKYAVDVDSLPSALENVKPPIFCEPCEKKGRMRMTSNTFCVTCDRKYCAAHQELHNELNGHHACLTIAEYLSSSYAAEEKFCTKHKDKVIGMGCSVCWNVYCTKCVSTIGTCNGGSNHKLMSIEELEQEVKGLFEPQKEEVEKKFDDWSAVMKEATMMLSNWDTETEVGLRQIDDIEQKQYEALRKKYTGLREEFKASRSKTKEKLVEYMENGAGVKVTEFHEKLKAFRACVSSKHCVDLLNDKEELQTQLDNMAECELPVLEITDLMRLEVDDAGKHELDIALTLANAMVIGDKLQVIKRKPPTSMQCLKSIAFHTGLNTACNYKGFTYVGIDNRSISRIDRHGNKTKNFIKLPNAPVTIRAHQDQLFVLIYGQPYQIMVYDLHGQQVKSWDHTDGNGSWRGNKLWIVGNEIFAADVTNQRIYVYTLEGKTEREIPCPLMQNSTWVSMCAAGRDSVIITTSTPKTVTRFNLRTSAVMWKTELKEIPYCSTMYYGAVLVGRDGYNNSRGVWIQVLDYKTGEKLRELSDRHGVQMNIFDLSIDKESILIPSYHEKTLHYYKINNN